jgi:hypothetical protein
VQQLDGRRKRAIRWNFEGPSGLAVPARPRSCYALRTSWFFSGSARICLPVAAKIALQSAGATSAGGGSPTPPQNPPLGMIMLSTFGASCVAISK